MFSGSCDGEIRVWDLPLRKTMWRAHSHAGFVRGLVIDQTGENLFTCGDDKTIKMYKTYLNIDGTVQSLNEDPEPSMIWYGKSPFTYIYYQFYYFLKRN